MYPVNGQKSLGADFEQMDRGSELTYENNYAARGRCFHKILSISLEVCDHHADGLSSQIQRKGRV